MEPSTNGVKQSSRGGPGKKRTYGDVYERQYVEAKEFNLDDFLNAHKGELTLTEAREKIGVNNKAVNVWAKNGRTPLMVAKAAVIAFDPQHLTKYTKALDGPGEVEGPAQRYAFKLFRTTEKLAKQFDAKRSHRKLTEYPAEWLDDTPVVKKKPTGRPRTVAAAAAVELVQDEAPAPEKDTGTDNDTLHRQTLISVLLDRFAGAVVQGNVMLSVAYRHAIIAEATMPPDPPKTLKALKAGN